MCIHIVPKGDLRLQAGLDVPVGGGRVVVGEERPPGGGGKPAAQQLAGPVELPDDRPEPAPDMPQLRAIIALGRIAHDSTVRALGGSPSRFVFGHAKAHHIGSIALFDSYHCSRYNTNTGRLTAPMFEDVFALARRAIDA